ncbi:hypothetical protein ON010_g11820 [Phytophthora cinnamomi]|nr:hypothetical protein ON010_g11820 [Phytophthora cinnamomi]
MALLLVLATISFAGGGVGAYLGAPEQDDSVVSFLRERTTWHPMCLYTFDDPGIGSSVTVANRVPGGACPFEALQPDNELVTSLNAAPSFWQLGVHLSEDPNNDTKRVQLSSISSVSAREFFTMAAVRNESVSESGVTFEMVIRPRAKTNQSMTLFSVANEYNNCVDPGFRLDLNEHRVLALIYFIPVLAEGGDAGVEACYEQRLFSVDTSAACQLPPVLDSVERTPAVQITVTLDPSSEKGLWKTDFYMSYTDVDTIQKVDCAVHDEQHPPSTQVLNKLIEGRYRLYLGNNPRNVISPRKRKRLAPLREFQFLGNSSGLNATERLRAMLKQKLMSISGPRLPKAMRIFGDNSLSLHILGVTFPPLNEDTPLAYLRSKIADFKEQYGGKIVDYLVNLVQQKASKSVVVQRSPVPTSLSEDFLTPSSQGSHEGNAFSRVALYQGTGGATFDLFHFAIYRRAVSEQQVNSITRQRLLPSRQFPSKQQTVRIPEDSLVLLNLTMLHGVFHDLRLELRELPEFGQLLLFPNQTAVTRMNIHAFQSLPLEYQRSIFFRPEPDQNNENLPLPNPVAFSRRLQPYATVRIGVVDSLAGRMVNKSTEARIDIFVDAVNDAPRPRNSELRISVWRGVPVTLELKGDDIDGAPDALSNTEASDAREFLSSFTYTNASTASSSHQLLKIVRMPKFGKLFDCNKTCDATNYAEGLDLEIVRVYRNNTDTDIATHSTNLMYLYHGWGQDNLKQDGAGAVVDELWYRLSDEDPGVFSDVGIIRFVLAGGAIEPVDNNTLTNIRLDEDSLQLINLGMLDPLASFFTSRTRFKLTTPPSRGSLFQVNDFNRRVAAGENTGRAAKNTSRGCIGARIKTAGAIVSDLLGRVVYAPKLNYFNMDPRDSFARHYDVEYFEYQVLETPTSNSSLMVHEKSPAALFSNGSMSRRVRLEIVNVPDDLVVLPPFVLIANSSSGGTVPAPVAFEDPDGTFSDLLYQVNLEATDGMSKFELGVVITDDDVMAGCPYERPCVLIWSTNGTHLNSSSNSTRDSELKYHITSQLYDPSHIQVTGTKPALSKALSQLVFRDLSGISPNIAHSAEFKLWIKRTGAGEEIKHTTQEITATFTITFPGGVSSETFSDENLVSALNSQLERYISTLLFMLAGWLVLSNSSCILFGFFCCCCSRARKKRRRKFDQQQRHFREQVAQNDYEYSVLLMSLADMVLQPDLLVSVSLLETCVSSVGSMNESEILMQAFILRSLLSLLESERQGTRFVFKLMAIEYAKGWPNMKGNELIFQRQEFLTRHSAASMALGSFCRLIGNQWMAELLMAVGDTRTFCSVNSITELDALVDSLAKRIEALPAEIIILCRACAKLFLKNGDKHTPEMGMDAVHLVFFNHFLGPALLYPRECVFELHPSTEQEKTMRFLAYQISEFPYQWRTHGKTGDFRSRSTSTDSLLDTFSTEFAKVAACQRKYEELMETISWSSTVASAYDPSEPSREVNCELMGMCLMNIHSLLDSYFPEFEQRLQQTQNSMNCEQVAAVITRMTRLLKALSVPLASIDELIECARPELLQDPLLWNDFSFLEWHRRAETQRVRRRPTHCIGGENPHSLLAEQFDDDSDCILEQEDESPHDADWLNTFDSDSRL